MAIVADWQAPLEEALEEMLKKQETRSLSLQLLVKERWLMSCWTMQIVSFIMPKNLPDFSSCMGRP